jgi:hypothetical protein
LSLAAHSITAKASDTAGNVSLASSSLSVTIVPASALIPSIPDLAGASDSGTSNTDNITSAITPTFTGAAPLGSTVTIFSDGVAVGSAIATTGTYSITTSALSNGAHSISAGNASGTSSSLSVTIDNTAPPVPSAPDLVSASDSGLSSTDDVTKVTALTFTGTAEVGSTVTIFSDGVAVGSGVATGGSYSIVTSTLSVGVHSITATATDAAGNTSVVSSALAVTIDTMAPAAPSVPDLAAASDSGSSSTDNITGITSPTFTGTAETGSTVTLFNDGAAVGSGVATGGSYSIITSPLAAGVHSITAQATDPSGNVGVASAGLSITIDTTAPAAPSVPDLAAASDNGSSSTDNITGITTPTFTGTAETGSMVTLFNDGVAVGSGVATVGSYSIITSPLAAGVHSVTAKATDAAGNVSAASSGLAVTIDLTVPSPPSVPILAAASDSGPLNADDITNVITPTFTGTAEAGSTVTIFSDGVAVGSGAATGGSYSIATSALSGGIHSITATATDPAGNISAASAGLSVTIDTAAPSSPSVPDLDAASDLGSSSSDNITAITTPTFTGTAETGSTVTIFSDGVAVGSGVATGGSYAVATSVLSEGTRNITATAMDIAGNVSAASVGLSVTIDTTAPATPSVPDLTSASDSGSSFTDDLTSVSAANFTGTADAGSTVTIFSDGVADGSGVATGGNYSIATSALADGAHSITAVATDVAGNDGAESSGLTVTIDTATPMLNVSGISPDTGISNSDGITTAGTVTVSGTIDVADAAQAVTVFRDGTSVGTATVSKTTGAWTRANVTLTEGAHTLTAQATDAAANIGTSNSFTVTKDTTAPAAPSTPDLAAASDSGLSSTDNVTNVTTPVFIGTAEAGSTVKIFSDGVQVGSGVATGGNYSIATSALAAGPHSITATATDAVDNVSAASSALSVTIDTTAPTAPSITSVMDDVTPGTGLLPNGASTNDTNLTVRVDLVGTGVAAGDAVQLYDGAGTSSPLGSYTLLAGDIINHFADVQTGTLATTGAFDLTARLIDQVANISGTSSAFTVVEDPSAICYAAGTRILTTIGEKLIESLTEGDIVFTMSGEELTAQPVKWVGRRRIDLMAHPRPRTVAPVRIRRHAFADNVPHRDLLVSPDHGIFIDGKMICARQLINGTTIWQERGWTSVEYFHVELDAHAMLFAEGLPAESYLNTGTRGFFANSDDPLLLHPDLTDETDCPTREAGSCVPFVWDEDSVRPVWRSLAERAEALGQPVPEPETTADPELRVVGNGQLVAPTSAENGLFVFVLPKGTTEVRLISRAGSLTDTRPWLNDHRCLGVYVERIVLRGASEMRLVPLDHPNLSQGWWAVERYGAVQRRWTDGDAVLPLPVLDGPVLLEIRASKGGMAYVTSAGEDRLVA